MQQDQRQQNPTRIYAKGRWTDQEHLKYVETLMAHGKNWKLLIMAVQTRTTSQIRSHSQKFFKKVKGIHTARRNKQKKTLYLNQRIRIELTDMLSKYSITANTPPEIVRFLRIKPPRNSTPSRESNSGGSKTIGEKEFPDAILDCRSSPSFFFNIMKWNNGFNQPYQALCSIIAFPKQISKEEQQKVQKQHICEGTMIEKAEDLNYAPDSAYKQ